MYPLISVIVPVFRVENYIRRCIESLLVQTYTAFEIILVNDGSDDGCPGICDEYAASSSRVKVLHKANGGLSDARNFGVKNAQGSLVTFVDSDDYVAESYLEDLWSLLRENTADMAVTGAIRENEYQKPLVAIGSGEDALLSNEQAFMKVCYGADLPIYAWAKLFYKDLLLKHPFPKGRLHEDVWTIPYIIAGCDRIAVGSVRNYHYVQRAQSILHGTFNEKYFDALEAAQELIVFAEQNLPGAVQAANGRLAIEANALLHRAVNSSEFKSTRKKVLRYLQHKWGWLVREKNIPARIKFQLLLCKLNGCLYRSIYNAFGG